MKKSLSTATAAAILTGCWLSLFIVALAIPSLLAMRHVIEADTLKDSLADLSDIYAPYIGAILAYFFVARTTPGTERITSAAAVVIAVVVSVLWNLVVIGPLVQVSLGQVRVEEAIKIAGDISSKLSWLVAPAIGFFFAKSESPTRHEPDQQGSASAMAASRR